MSAVLCEGVKNPEFFTEEGPAEVCPGCMWMRRCAQGLTGLSAFNSFSPTAVMQIRVHVAPEKGRGHGNQQGILLGEGC